MMEPQRGLKGRRIVWSVVAGTAALGAVIWTFRGADLEKVASLVWRAEPLWVLMLLASVPAEQLIRGWKWRQLLFELKPVGSLRLFGAVVAGYFANIVIPIGVSPFVRSWLIARLEELRFATVVMTTAIERFVDGVVFAGLVMIVAIGAALPRTDGDLRTGLVLASLAGFTLFCGLLAVLFAGKRSLLNPNSRIRYFANRVEGIFGPRLAGLGDALAGGITWPRSPWRGLGVVLASLAMKAVSITHFLWAGLAIGIVLSPFDYIFLMVFAGFALILARFIRIPGGFVIGSAYGLKLLAVPDEQALAMVLLVHLASVVMTIGFGALALWLMGISVQDVRKAARISH